MEMVHYVARGGNIKMGKKTDWLLRRPCGLLRLTPFRCACRGALQAYARKGR